MLHSQKLEAVGTLAGGIAHELNNALVPILALSRMILDGLPPGTEMREDVEIITLASQRAKNLVQGILAFSRKGEASRREVDAVPLVRQTLAMLRATLPATLRIKEEIAPVPPLLADGDALQQVLINLVTNAAHAIGNAIGTITVAVEAVAPEEVPSHRSGKEFVRLRVADTGCGMDAMTVQRIFEPFFTTKGVGEGTGLGLSVVHGIVSDHGGRIDVASEPGKGTEFTICLPSSQRPRRCWMRWHERRRGCDSGIGKMKILVIDDDKLVLYTLSRLLRGTGSTVSTAENGAKAMDLVRKEQPDVVITDIVMPDQEGLEHDPPTAPRLPVQRRSSRSPAACGRAITMCWRWRPSWARMRSSPNRSSRRSC